MSRSEYVRYNPGESLYAKPSPLATTPWTTGVVDAVPNGTTGEYVFDNLDNTSSYTVFVKAGIIPDVSDIAIAQLSPSGSGSNIVVEDRSITLD